MPRLQYHPAGYEALVDRVRKPSSYLGTEVNAVRKDLDRVAIRVALVFPDLYEIGMSYLGLKILYKILNDCEHIAAERVYAPGTDMAEFLRDEGLSLVSLESRLPLYQFDVVGISLPYELTYTNVLEILDLGGIPLHSEERSLADPLVVAGGPTAFNPEPLADFLDAVLLGDGEEMLLEVVEAYSQLRASGAPREKILDALADIEGVYIPSLFRVAYDRSGAVRELVPLRKGYERVRRRILPDLNRAPYPTAQVVPYGSVVHDRIALEVSRGCTRGCRFCQAGVTYRPLRERDEAEVVALALETIQETGYEDVSLSSLSVGDYSCLHPLVSRLALSLAAQYTALSLPSLRPLDLANEVLMGIQEVRRPGLTWAPEAGTPRLRRVINKDIDEEAFLNTIRRIAEAGWDAVKLYFMIGLPTETPEDIRAICGLCRRVAGAAGGKLKVLHIAISSFVPKAHTPFQWVGQVPRDELLRRARVIRSALRGRRYEVKWHRVETSFLEAVFSRGNRQLCPMLERAWRLGARFDSWADQFNYAIWERAFEETGVHPEVFANGSYELSAVLPWDHIDVGVSKEFLAREYERSFAEEVTPDCRLGCVDECGLCEGMARNVVGRSVSAPVPQVGCSGSRQTDVVPVWRYRVHYRKIGGARYLSQLELNRVMHRAFRRAGLLPSYTRGFHPRPRIQYGPALAVGVESYAEELDCYLQRLLDPDDLAARLAQVLPEGLEVVGCRRIPLKSASLSENIRGVEYRVDALFADGDARANSVEFHEDVLSQFWESRRVDLPRIVQGEQSVLNLKMYVRELAVLEQRGKRVAFQLALRALNGVMPRPEEILRKVYEPFAAGIDSARVVKVRVW